MTVCLKQLLPAPPLATTTSTMTFVPPLATALLALCSQPHFHTTQTHRISTISFEPSRHITSSATRTQLYATGGEGDSVQRYDDLVKWFSSYDKAFVSPKFEIRPSTRGGLETGGYGAFAKEDIAKNDVILTFTREACVTLDDAFADKDCGEAFKKLAEQAGPGADTVILAGYLAKEYLLMQENDKREKEGEKATNDIKFGAYLRTLPWERYVNAQEHVLFWEDDYVDNLLKGSLAYEDAVEIRSTVSCLSRGVQLHPQYLMI